jgi:hypothetical protein
VAAHTRSDGIRCGSAHRGLACGPTASGQPYKICRPGCGSARCRPRCVSHRVGRAHGIQGIHCVLGGVRVGARQKNLLGFGMAFQVLDAGPASAAARLNLAGVGRGRRQGDTFIGESWVPQRFRLVKENKVLGSNPWLGDDAKAGLNAWDFRHARRRGRGWLWPAKRRARGSVDGRAVDGEFPST